MQVRGKHLACTRYAEERGVQMTKCEVSVVLFALGISRAMGTGQPYALRRAEP